MGRDGERCHTWKAWKAVLKCSAHGPRSDTVLNMFTATCHQGHDVKDKRQGLGEKRTGA